MRPKCAVTAGAADPDRPLAPSPACATRRYRQAVRTIVGATSSGSADASDRRVVEALTLLLKLPEHTYGSNDGLVVGWPWDNAAFDRLAANKVRRTRARARLSSMEFYTYVCTDIRKRTRVVRCAHAARSPSRSGTLRGAR